MSNKDNDRCAETTELYFNGKYCKFICFNFFTLKKRGNFIEWLVELDVKTKMSNLHSI